MAARRYGPNSNVWQGRRYYATVRTLSLVAGSCGLFLLVCYLTERAGILFTICPLKNFTGIPCPFCGGTRAALALLQGNIHGAFLLNPLAASFCLLAVPASLVYYGLFKHRQRELKIPRVLWVFLLAVIAANWVYLIAAGR